MNWSISKAKIFSICQRKWFYSEIMARKNSKDKNRFEAYVLKQLGSIHAWRGKIVDQVIEDVLVPEFNKSNVPPFEKIETYVNDLMKKQLEFAKLRKYREPKLTKMRAGDRFCALREIENAEGLENDSVEKIREQVITALTNLLQSDLMKILLDSGTVLVAQKNLNYKYEEFNIISRPDLIVYSRDEPAMIIDWKVHFFRKENARMQLGIYAIALTECISFDPFQKPLNDPTEIQLIEYQLLKNFQRTYRLTSSDVSSIKDYINKSSKDMAKLINNKKYHEFNINQFNMAFPSEICEYCNFKRLCRNRNVKYQVNLLKYINN